MASRRKKRPPGRPRKDKGPGTPAEVRARLIQAALELVREKGAKAVTTTSLAARAGISQSGFYQHFENVDACLGEAALQFAEQMRLELRAMRERFFTNMTKFDEASIRERLLSAYRYSLDYALDEPRLTELMMFFRFRLESSPFGAALTAVNEQVKDDMTAELCTVGARWGMEPELYRPGLRVYVQLVLAMWAGAVEALLTDPNASRELLVEMLTRSTQATLYANMPRWAREKMEQAG